MKIKAVYIVRRDEDHGTVYKVVADRGMTHVVMGTLISRDVAVTLARALGGRYGVDYTGEQFVA